MLQPHIIKHRTQTALLFQGNPATLLMYATSQISLNLDSNTGLCCLRRPVSVSGMQWRPPLSQQSSYTSQRTRGRVSPSHRQQSPVNHTTTQPEVAPGEPTDEEIACAFAVYDPDSTTFISTGRLGDLMRDLGMPLNAHQLTQAEAQLDRTQCGQVSFGDFLLWWKG